MEQVRSGECAISNYDSSMDLSFMHTGNSANSGSDQPTKHVHTVTKEMTRRENKDFLEEVSSLRDIFDRAGVELSRNDARAVVKQLKSEGLKIALSR